MVTLDRNTLSLLLILLFQVASISMNGCNMQNKTAQRYILLNENYVEGVNTLNQEMLKCENAIYEIRFHFQLLGMKLYIPRNSVLKFTGGSLSNGTIVGSDTQIISTSSLIFKNIKILGSWHVQDIYTHWFDFGIIKDDYQNFQNIMALTEDSIQNNVHFENKVFNTSKTQHLLNVKSNTTIYLNKSSICILPNSDKNYCVINIRGVQNVNIIGGTIIGDIKQHISTSGFTDEWNHGIRISGSKNVRIKDTRSMYHMGDGVDIIDKTNSDNTVTLSEDIFLENVICDNNGRQGFSIEGAKNVVMDHCMGINTGQIRYVKPSLGLDIEPWRKDGICSNINIINCKFSNNRANNSSLDVIIQPNYLLAKSEEQDNSICLKNSSISSNIYVRHTKGLTLDSLHFEKGKIISIEESSNLKVRNILNLEKIGLTNSHGVSINNLSSKILHIVGVTDIEVCNINIESLVAKNSQNIDFKKIKLQNLAIPANKDNSYFENCKNIEFRHCCFSGEFVRSEGVIFNKYKILDCCFNITNSKNKELRISNVSNIENCTFNVNQEVVICNPANSVCVVYSNRWQNSASKTKNVAMRVHNNNNAILYFIDNVIVDSKHALAFDFGTETVNYYSTQKIQPHAYGRSPKLSFLEESLGTIKNKKAILSSPDWNSLTLADSINFKIKPTKPREGRLYKNSDGYWLIFKNNHWKQLQSF